MTLCKIEMILSRCLISICLLTIVRAGTYHGGSTEWKVNEVFSNGSVLVRNFRILIVLLNTSQNCGVYSIDCNV